MYAKFEGNSTKRLHFMVVFASVQKKKKKTKKMSDFLKAHISRMASTIYFRSGPSLS